MRKNERKTIKVTEAKERTKYRSSISAVEQLKALDNRLGKGVGAEKERIKLNKIIEKNDG